MNEDALAANRANWESRVPVHPESLQGSPVDAVPISATIARFEMGGPAS